jgi:hypothetical protein
MLDAVTEALTAHPRAFEIYTKLYAHQANAIPLDQMAQIKILSASLMQERTSQELAFLYPKIKQHLDQDEVVIAIFQGKNAAPVLAMINADGKSLTLTETHVKKLSGLLRLDNMKEFYAHASAQGFEKLIKTAIYDRLKNSVSDENLQSLREFGFTKDEINAVIFKYLTHLVARQDWSAGAFHHFIKQGFDINFQNDQGQTLLMLAVQKKDHNLLCRLLQEFKADAFLKDENGKTAFDYAEQSTSRIKEELARYHASAQPDVVIFPKKAIAPKLLREDLFLFETGEHIVRLHDEEAKTSSHSIQKFADASLPLLEKAFNLHAARGGQKKFSDYEISAPKHRLSHLTKVGAKMAGGSS